jgi:predicted permease
MLAVGLEFFETMRLPLVGGRTFSNSDLQSDRAVAIVNQTFVQRFLGGKNPLGVHLGGTTPSGREIEREIVGIIGDAKYDNLRKSVEPTAYVPLQEGAAHFAIRTSTQAEALVPTVRQVVASFDENLPLFEVRTQTETIDRLLFNERLVAQLSCVFGALALILACIGLYGLLSYEVGRRTREIGIRMALGAQRADVLKMILRYGIKLAVGGVGIGLVLSLVLTRFLAHLLYGVKAADPLTFAVVAVVLIGVALLAGYIPAGLAMNADPMVALRYE